MRTTYRLITFAIRQLFRIAGHYKIVHPERMQSIRGSLLASNHLSNLDPPILGSLIPFEIFYLGKAELFKNKIFGAILRHINVISVKRGVLDMKAIKQVQGALTDGYSVLVFPEGTRRGKVIKPGVGLFAMSVKKPIVPIYLENTDEVGACMLFKKRMKMVIGEPIPVEYFSDWEENKASYQKLADYIFEKIQELKHEC